MLERLKKVLEKARSIAILTHSNADPDAIASLCTMVVIVGNVVKNSKIYALVPESISIEARRIAEKCYSNGIEIQIIKKGIDIPREIDLCILVDTASLEQLKTLKEIVYVCKDVIVVDHHAQREVVDDGKNVLYFVDTSASSTSEIVFEISKKLSIALPIDLLEALLAGIVYDTKRFVRGSSRTFRNVADIIDFGANYENALSLTVVPKPIHQKIAKIKCLLRHRGFKISINGEGVYLALSEVGAYESDCANTLLTIGYDMAFVFSEDDVLKASRVVYRAREEALNKLRIEIYRDIIAKLVEIFGGGGGGHRVAGAAILRIRDPDIAAQHLLKVLSQLFKDRIKEIAESRVAS